jgi:hypothetical protein
VDVVRDAVARARVTDTVARRKRLQVAVFVHVLVVDLQDVVVYVHHRERDVDAVRLKCLELERGHRARGVLDKYLVHGEVYLLARNEIASQQVGAKQLIGEVLRTIHAGHTLLRSRASTRW